MENQARHWEGRGGEEGWKNKMCKTGIQFGVALNVTEWVWRIKQQGTCFCWWKKISRNQCVNQGPLAAAALRQQWLLQWVWDHPQILLWDRSTPLRTQMCPGCLPPRSLGWLCCDLGGVGLSKVVMPSPNPWMCRRLGGFVKSGLDKRLQLSISHL